MAVSYNATSESHGNGLGSTNESSFSWTHTTGISPKGILVFTFVNANADNATSVTYGGNSVSAVVGGRANSTNASFPGDCKAWFLGSGIPSGNQTVVVNRTNNANTMYAVAISFNALTDTATAGTVLLTADNTTITQQSVDDGSPGTDSLRVAAVNIGLGDINANFKVTNNNLLPGVNSKWIDDPTTVLYAGSNYIGLNDFGSRVVGVVKESSAGQGSRSVGFAGTYFIVPSANTGIAAVHLAVTESSGGGGAAGDPRVILPGLGLPTPVVNAAAQAGLNNRVMRIL